METIEELLTRQQFSSISLISTSTDFLLLAFMLSIVSWFYKKYSRVLGGKAHVGSILPLIGLTVFLVIIVIKSSLALSLGLVGALSIVRFRTPIKEPEELGFLFLVIAMGLGFGAGFRDVTILTTLSILAYLRIFSGNVTVRKQRGEYTLILNVPLASYSKAISILERSLVSMKVTRIADMDGVFEVYVAASMGSDFDTESIYLRLRELDAKIHLQIIEAGVNW